MFSGGIVAVGDISNLNHSLEIKKASRIKYHTFLEIFDLNPSRADEVFSNALALESEFINNNLKEVSITPHAPYTVSTNLLKLIDKHAEKRNSPLSIHNQE